MKKFSDYTPFLVLIFLVCVTGISTYKINLKQQAAKENASVKKDNEAITGFVKEKIILPEFSLPNLYDESQPFSNKDLIGKYSLINFFASWCTTCRAEHENLMRLKDFGIVDIYGVAWRDINQNTKNYLTKSGNPFVKVASDNKALFTKIMGLDAVPETLVIDPECNVILRYQGNLEDYVIEDIKAFIASKKIK